MFIGSLLLEIYIPDAGSLKEKRMYIRSLKEKLRSKFNVSVAEVGNQDLWQSAQVAVVLVSPDRGQTDKQLDTIISFIESHFPELHINFYREIL